MVHRDKSRKGDQAWRSHIKADGEGLPEKETVNPRVSSLLKKLMDFEWDFIQVLQTTHTLTSHTHTYTHTLSLSHTHTHSLSPHTHSLLISIFRYSLISIHSKHLLRCSLRFSLNLYVRVHFLDSLHDLLVWIVKELLKQFILSLYIWNVHLLS